MSRIDPMVCGAGHNICVDCGSCLCDGKERVVRRYRGECRACRLETNGLSPFATEKSSFKESHFYDD